MRLIAEHSVLTMASIGRLAAESRLCNEPFGQLCYDSAMPAIYLHNVKVTDEHIDIQGHANNLVYLRWMQDAAVAHSAAQGWDGERYRELSAGWVVRSHFIEYLVPESGLCRGRGHGPHMGP